MMTRLLPRRRLGRLLSLSLLLALPVVPPAEAQFIPYYGKNKVKYDNFAWRVYKSPHFEVYYYPEFEQHLARLVSYLESAYLKLSTGLKHELSHPVPAILYKTHSEFEQTNLYPSFVPEGVLAFAEPLRGRLVLPIDEAPDRLMGLIQHEMTHVFAFDLIPRTLVQRDIPLWIDEGLADYFRGMWDDLDLMMIRDAAVTDQVPKLSRAQFEAFSGRLVYNLGHACFEYMESRYGKEGIRQFLYTLRKGILGGTTEEIFKQAFRTTPEEFDQGFDKWLKERFKPFRDKERPSDYGREISPNSEKTPFTQVFGFAPSPSGEMVAAITADRSNGKATIVLLSSKDGQVINHLTPGFPGEYENLSISEEFVAGRSIAFDPKGDAVAFFGRVNKGRTLFLISVLDGRVLRSIPVSQDLPQGPCLLPDGRHVLYAGLREGVSDIWMLDLETKKAENLTRDEYADADPQISPDGKLVVYSRRISGHDKIYSFPLDNPSQKTQLTFGAFDDDAPIFSSDGKKVYYASNEDNDIPNLRSLDLETGVIKQYTDVLGGNMAPAPLKGGKQGDRLAFISYFKNEYKLQTKDLAEPLKEVEQEVQSAAEGLVDFQPDVAHQVVPENKRRKRLFEGLYLEGRPPINVGVTSSGDFFGGTAIGLTDVLGDHNFTFTALSIREFRTYEGTYINLAKRLHYGITGFDTTSFFYASPYGLQTGFFRQGAIATQRYSGGQFIAQYPLNKFRRLEMSAGIIKIKEQFENADAEAQVCAQAVALGVPCFLNNGWFAPASVNLVTETTRFAEFGPLAGETWTLGVTGAPGMGGFHSRWSVEGDARKYLRLGSTSTLLALRLRGFWAGGDSPAIYYFGGNMEMRGYQYLGFSGNRGFFGNAEIRFPLINLAATPIGVLGPIRGTVFFGAGGAYYRGEHWQFSTGQAGNSFVNDPVFGTPVTGFRLVDGRASYGVGLQLFFLGYPLHFDWSRATDLKTSAPWAFDFWVGFDF
jgi:dipeptidyl aminopeptidase/acylaminoacyl peptidase